MDINEKIDAAENLHQVLDLINAAACDAQMWCDIRGRLEDCDLPSFGGPLSAMPGYQVGPQALTRDWPGHAYVISWDIDEQEMLIEHDGWYRVVSSFEWAWNSEDIK